MHRSKLLALLLPFAAAGFDSSMLVSSSVAQEPLSFDSLAQRYDANARPLLQRYCLDCHSTDDKQGELDLEQFAAIDDVRRQPTAWQQVAHMVDDRQMPPEDAPQLSDDERRALLAWTRDYLDAEAHASAGDPGPVTLRRLNNAEFTYTIQDLTGLPLEPAHEFPVDGAAGEGFANAGQALVMSPALFAKYLESAKQVASHMELLPDRIGFSLGTTRRDFSDQRIARIKELYARYSDEAGGIPWSKYMAAAADVVLQISDGSQESHIELIAAQHQVSPRFLTHLLQQLNSDEPSPILEPMRREWYDIATTNSEDRNARLERIASHFRTWQEALVRFQTVGHLKPWQVDIDPVVDRVDVRFPLPAPDADGRVVVQLAVGDAGDGSEGDVTVWEQLRLVGAGRADLPLSELQSIAARRYSLRESLIEATPRALAAIASVDRSDAEFDLLALSEQYQVRPDLLAAWASMFGIGDEGSVELERFAQQIDSANGYDFVKGWGSHETPLILASSADNEVRIPGRMKGHGVTVHPSPTRDVAIGWQSPITGSVQISSIVSHAHPECGNGVSWAIEVRRGRTRRRVAEGVSHGGAPVAWQSESPLVVRPGDLVSLLIGPRNGDHSCDLTDVEFSLTEVGSDTRSWNLTEEVSPNILAGNPHDDRLGNVGVWSFYSEPIGGDRSTPLLPAGSTLAAWTEANDAERSELAAKIAAQLIGGSVLAAGSPDAQVRDSIRALGAPCYLVAEQTAARLELTLPVSVEESIPWGVKGVEFGVAPDGSSVAAGDLVIAGAQGSTTTLVEVVLPADFAAGCELVAGVSLHPTLGALGSVQPRVVAGAAITDAGLQPGMPVLTRQARERFLQQFSEFRRSFPAGLCYRPVVPVDEVVTLALFHREDQALSDWMLTSEEQADLNRQWDELHFVAQDALTMVDGFQQLMEYATQDSDPSLFEPFREPIRLRAEAFRQEMLAAEPAQLASLLEFTAKAYRRPLSNDERSEFESLYQTLRSEAIPHDEALRLVLVRALCSASFLYKLEEAGPGKESKQLSDFELATRLSYFLWSSTPDEQLLADAASGRLQDEAQLKLIVQRMLNDDRVRRMAIEFGCRYLQIHDFASHDEKSERHFPTFVDVRDELYEEPIQFITDLLRNNGSVMSLFDADHTFVNAALAAHYGIAGVEGDEWRRVDGVQQAGRGGVLGFGATLSKNSGASRTSPILRGNWISEVLLGEKLPKPPQGVPPLPEEEGQSDEMTMRQIVERHTSDERCSGCHRRIDPMGFALEEFDSIGRLREIKPSDIPLDVSTTLLDGTQVTGIAGMRNYLSQTRGEQVERVFCRKLLGYALGRAVRLSDEPLLDEMMSRLASDGHQVHGAIELIVTSRQFREIRGQEVESDDVTTSASE